VGKGSLGRGSVLSLLGLLVSAHPKQPTFPLAVAPFRLSAPPLPATYVCLIEAPALLLFVVLS
jgi:hypothetical protein